MSFSECPCTDILLMRSIMDSPLGVIFFALDTEYKYLYFSKTHATTFSKLMVLIGSAGVYASLLLPRICFEKSTPG